MFVWSFGPLFSHRRSPFECSRQIDQPCCLPGFARVRRWPQGESWWLEADISVDINIMIIIIINCVVKVTTLTHMFLILMIDMCLGGPQCCGSLVVVASRRTCPLQSRSLKERSKTHVGTVAEFWGCSMACALHMGCRRQTKTYKLSAAKQKISVYLRTLQLHDICKSHRSLSPEENPCSPSRCVKSGRTPSLTCGSTWCLPPV